VCSIIFAQRKRGEYLHLITIPSKDLLRNAKYEILLCYTVNKGLAISVPAARMSLTKLSLAVAGNNVPHPGPLKVWSTKKIQESRK